MQWPMADYLGLGFPITLPEQRFNGAERFSTIYSVDLIRGEIANANFKGELPHYITDLSEEQTIKTLQKTKRGRLLNMKIVNSIDHSNYDNPKTISSVKSGRGSGTRKYEVYVWNPNKLDAFTECNCEKKFITDRKLIKESELLKRWNANGSGLHYRSRTCPHVGLVEAEQRDRGKSIFGLQNVLRRSKLQKGANDYVYVLSKQNRPDYLLDHLLFETGLLDGAIKYVNQQRGTEIDFHEETYVSKKTMEIAKKLGGRKGTDHGIKIIGEVKDMITI